MASWHYAFLFPRAGGALEPEGVIDALAKFGFEFDGFIRVAVEIDEHGHLEHGDEMPLDGSVRERLKSLFIRGEQFQVECRNEELFISCSFATRYSNPYVMLGWSIRLFSQLSEPRRNQYWNLFRECAKRCKSTHVIIVDDPPDYFEDRFLEIEGRRFLENELPSGNRYNIHAVWTDCNLCDTVPEGVNDASRREIPGGFIEHSVS